MLRAVPRRRRGPRAARPAGPPRSVGARAPGLPSEREDYDGQARADADEAGRHRPGDAIGARVSPQTALGRRAPATSAATGAKTLATDGASWIAARHAKYRYGARAATSATRLAPAAPATTRPHPSGSAARPQRDRRDRHGLRRPVDRRRRQRRAGRGDGERQRDAARHARDEDGPQERRSLESQAPEVDAVALVVGPQALAHEVGDRAADGRVEAREWPFEAPPGRRGEAVPGARQRRKERREEVPELAERRDVFPQTHRGRLSRVRVPPAPTCSSTISAAGATLAPPPRPRPRACRRARAPALRRRGRVHGAKRVAVVGREVDRAGLVVRVHDGRRLGRVREAEEVPRLVREDGLEVVGRATPRAGAPEVVSWCSAELTSVYASKIRPSSTP